MSRIGSWIKSELNKHKNLNFITPYSWIYCISDYQLRLKVKEMVISEEWKKDIGVMEYPLTVDSPRHTRVYKPMFEKPNVAQPYFYYNLIDNSILTDTDIDVMYRYLFINLSDKQLRVPKEVLRNIKGLVGGWLPIPKEISKEARGY